MPAFTTTSTLAAPAAPRLPEPLELGVCGCGLELVCLVDDVSVTFCERCELGLPLAAPASRH
jgi:hypothetical protein